MSLKVIAVDNEPTSLKLIRSLAVELGHTVLTSEDYQVAQQWVETRRLHVVFIGMGMAESDGFVLARHVRNSQLNRESTIVMLSSNDEIKTLRKAFSEGADLVLTKPIAASRLRPVLAAMDSPGWNSRRHSARMPLFTPVKCIWDDRQFSLRSLNISEGGILLQPSIDVAVGQEVQLEFTIAEVGATLNVLARIVRQEEARSVGLEFIGLAPEQQNAIQLYIIGRLRGPERPRNSSFVRTRRLLDRFD